MLLSKRVVYFKRDPSADCSWTLLDKSLSSIPLAREDQE
jgi:hypothetical protein